MILTEEWCTSSRSKASQGIEVRQVHDVVQIRNGRLPDAGTVECTVEEWDALLAGVEAGEFLPA